MATIQQRGTVDKPSWRVLWRLGGTRTGRQQSSTWTTEKHAQQAKQIAEAHRHNITDDEVNAAILGVNNSAPTVGSANLTSPTVRDYAERWLASRTRTTAGTLATYRGQFRREILPALGDKRLHEVTGMDVANLLNALRVKFSDATVTRYYSALHAMLAFAVRDKVIGDNPAARTDYVRDLVNDPGDDGDEHAYLEPWEYRLIVDNAAADAKPLIEFLAGTGCRYSEATAVPVSAVDLLAQPPSVRIHRAWKHDGTGRWYLGPTKSRGRRTVSFGRAVLDAVLPCASGETGDKLLFRAPGGDRWDYKAFWARRWNPAVAAAMRCHLHPPDGAARQVTVEQLAGPRCGDNGGVRTVGKARGQRCGARVQPGWDRCPSHLKPDVSAVSTCDCPTRLRRRPTIHDLRHSHVAWQIAAGTPMQVISKRLGHHSTTITEQVYAGILPHVDAASGAVFDDLVRPSGGRGGASTGRPGVRPGAVPVQR